MRRYTVGAMFTSLLIASTVPAATVFNPKETGGVPLMLSEKENKCSAIPNGTRVKVLDSKVNKHMPAIKYVKVRVLEGPCEGDEGWVLEVHIRD